MTMLMNIYPYLKTLLSPSKEYFCQYADGDSMINENINQGDLIVFEKSNQIRNGEVGCFTIDDNDADVKITTVMIIITALYYNQLILNIHPL